ncbi:MAG: hypothetical protein RBS68_11000 [Anaerolineales bacterium]|jgi:hypothetical protein|nr:hypothetical protein [Anaerolineales bacterium]
MSKNTAIVKSSDSRILVGGAVIGAFTGLIAATLLSRQAEKNQRESLLSTNEGIKIGLLVFGLLRAITAIGDD